MIKRMHLTVTGVVQGVGFRYFIHSSAVRLGLDGFVRNNYNDNTVEITVQGEEMKLRELLSLARKGPAAASVTGVVVSWEEPKNITGFEIT